MPRSEKLQNRVTLFFILALFAWIYLYLETEIAYYGWIQVVLQLGLIIGWGYTVHVRLIQVRIRHFLKLLCLMFALWFLFRGLKYYAYPPGTTAARWLWYLYYIPMLFFPVCAMLATLFIGKPDDSPLKRGHLMHFVVAFFLLLVVLTNDLHQLVFIFPEDELVHSDLHYRYGPLYYPLYAWIMILLIGAMVQLIIKCRRPNRRRMIVGTVLFFMLGILYDIGYVTGFIPVFRDLAMFTGIFTVATFESAIRAGLIRSNASYREIFTVSTISAQILDTDLEVVYSSNQAESLDSALLRQVVLEGKQVRNRMRLSSAPIRGGYVVWQEDISPLLDTQEQLEAANEMLAGMGQTLQRRYETNLKRKRLEEQNRLYNEMQDQTAEKLEKASWLLQRFAAAKPEEEDLLLLQLGVIAAYLKRRNNLIFLSEENHILSRSELRYCIEELIRMLEEFGISCVLNMEGKSGIALENLVCLYDALEEVLEQTAVCYPSYYLSVTGEDSPVLRIRISGIQTPPTLDCPGYCAEEEDEGEYLLMIPVGEEAEGK